MQNLVMYSIADSTLGTVRDFANSRNLNAPIFTRGFSALIKLRLFSELEVTDPYPIELFDSIDSWQCVWDVDYDQSTNPILVADNANIFVHQVTETINENEYTFTEIVIPVPDMNTQELVALIGTNEMVSNLNMELVGFNSNADEVFGLQIKGFSARNRIYYGGSPTVIEPDYLTASQVRALVAAGVAIQYSADGENWHDTQDVQNDCYLRFRSASSADSQYSSPIALLRGLPGQNGDDGVTPHIGENGHWHIGAVDTGIVAVGQAGTSSHLYKAYASDNAGTDFSLTASDDLKYIAMFVSDVYIETPTLEDFEEAEAVWVKYIGDDGTGVGDMTKAVYDTNNNGKVDVAEKADEADSVDWDNVQNKPESFTPSAHHHNESDMDNPVVQNVLTTSTSNTLHLNKPVLRKNNAISGTLTIDITSIKDKDGNAAEISNVECYTWEYHVLANGTITQIIVGSMQSTMSSINIPDTLELINGNNTYHVFVIRGFYKSGAVNNIDLHVNFAYSYEA